VVKASDDIATAVKGSDEAAAALKGADDAATPVKPALTNQQHADKLKANMRAEGRAPGPGQAAAHIVPSGGKKNQWKMGEKSRKLLKDYGVDVDAAANGIVLGHPRPHNYTHRGGFHQKVYRDLRQLVLLGEGRGLDKDAIGVLLKDKLRSIGKAVEQELAGGSPGPGAYWTA
jgi:hypothetical protein